MPKGGKMYAESLREAIEKNPTLYGPYRPSKKVEKWALKLEEPLPRNNFFNPVSSHAPRPFYGKTNKKI